MRRSIRRLSWFALSLVFLFQTTAAAELTVFGAASLTDALQEIGKLYQADLAAAPSC